MTVRPRSPDDAPGQRIVRIVLAGSESTGKTVLARQLGDELAFPCVPEYAREYAAQVHRERRELRDTDVEPIARGQIALEDAATSLHPRALILDTDLVSTVVYARHYYGGCPQWIVDEARARLGNLYLLLDTDIAWTMDNVRDRPDVREDIQQMFRHDLRAFGANVVEVSGSGTTRLHRALQAVHQLLFLVR